MNTIIEKITEYDAATIGNIWKLAIISIIGLIVGIGSIVAVVKMLWNMIKAFSEVLYKGLIICIAVAGLIGLAAILPDDIPESVDKIEYKSAVEVYNELSK